MRLTAIKLAGFKSFVEPTTLRLSSHLTGIVGPNGCGKSNVIDAVRWVTGESSAKQLRGEAMSDVIFNGSKARKPVGRASIELVFDNSQGKLGGAYAGFAEIAIRRELTRDGASHYAINANRCRRRDVVDLFLGTGLGGRSNYAVIEQGAVNRLIEAKPEEIRQVLEEAAGISRYKERRRETENRIRHTRDNLDRLNDLIGEISQRLAQLRRQAANAEKYKQCKAEERKHRAELLALRWRALEHECERQQALLEERKRELEAASLQARAVASRRQEQATEQQQASHATQRLQADFYAAEGEVARVDQALAHAREMERVQRAELEGLEHQAAELDDRIAAEKISVAALTRGLDESTRALDEVAAEDARARAQLETAQRDAADGEAEWESLAGDQANPLHRAETERARVEHLEQDVTGIGLRLEKLLAERARIDEEAPQQALTEAEDGAQRLARDLEAALDEQQVVEAEVGRLRARRGEVDTALADLRQSLASARGHLGSLAALQQAALREDDAGLREWLGERNWDDAASAAHLVRVTDGWEKAAEAALGEVLRGLCLDDFEPRTNAVSAWPEQGLTVLDKCLDDEPGLGSGGPRGTRSLATVISGPAVLRRLARRTFLVADETAARACVRQLDADQMVVTRAGTCFGPGWLRVPAQGDHQEGVLKREQTIAQHQKEVHGLATMERDRAAELEGIRERIAAAERGRSEQGERLDGLRRRHGEVLAERQGLSVRLEQVQRRRRELDGEIEELDGQRREREAALAGARRSLDGSTDAAREFVQRRQHLHTRLRELREHRDRARRGRDRLLERQQALRVELAGKHSAVQAGQQRLAEFGASRRRLGERLQGLETQMAQATVPQAQTAHAKAEAEGRRDAARKELELARTRLGQVESQVEEIARRAQAADAAMEGVRETLQQARVGFETAAVRRQTVEEQLAEAGYTPQALTTELADDASPAAWEQRLDSLERRIQRLGAINLAAIDEFEQEQEREVYLQTQHADLAAALATLETAIAKIDRETRSRFRATYDQVDQRFGALFPRLFGGGEARLELTEDDLLATGVRVMARPPGKRNASIQMLSGGEKALTAVALLFALFELNPAPFCLLDEIDAPLDDANVARFCDLVQHMAERVQFIVITHNKLTMEMAQQLHGVTMTEPGVSRLVSVDIDQALAMAS